MNLEGTKHEKAVLVVLAYIIGFISSFIAFGMADFQSDIALESEVPSTFIPEGYMPPTENPPSDTDMEIEEVSASADGASYEEGKLYANVRGERYVLSLHNDIVEKQNVEGFSTQGIHVALPTYSSSPDGRYVHFCEQQTEKEECTHFMFDSVRNVIQPMSINGEKLITSDEVAKTALWIGTDIEIGNYKSLSAETPWKVGISPNL